MAPVDNHHCRSKDELYDLVHRISAPVLNCAANGTLIQQIPRFGEHPAQRAALEALARVLSGLAPALELNHHHVEDHRFKVLAAQARRALDVATQPLGQGKLQFGTEQQCLVECAFLAVAFLRAPHALWDPLSESTKENVIAALRASRDLMPLASNWVLFPAIIEAFFLRIGLPYDPVRIEYALRQMHQWYIGDGFYKDGEQFKFDYYNSIIIHPLLIEIKAAIEGKHIHQHWTDMLGTVTERALVYAKSLRNLIFHDGSYPLIGRSLTYRAGVFHLLSQLILKHQIPDFDLRADTLLALNASIRHTLGSHSNFDAAGWLTVGITGLQEDAAETYISRGSLFFVCNAFLHLGVHEGDPMWHVLPPPNPRTQS